MRRLSLKRRPRGTNEGKTQGQWHSAESLSSPVIDGTRILSTSSAARGRPPLPPPHASLSDNKSSRTEGPGLCNELKPQPAVRTHAPQKHSSQDVTNQPPQPFPRRRLASFGGVSSPGSRSPFTGFGTYNLNNNGTKPPGTEAEISSVGTRGSTGSLKLSPQSSGRNTPVSSQGSMHLQHVREQMVVALQRLKELEEQVKIIPVLQVKISVLQEEKRQLAFQLKNQSDNEDDGQEVWKRLNSLKGSDVKKHKEELWRMDDMDMREIRQEVKGGCPQVELGEPFNTQFKKAVRSENKYTSTNQVETRSIATEVCDIDDACLIRQAAEVHSQKLVNVALKDRVSHLEAELKESALQTELTRLKLELQVAGAKNRVDKACTARPSMASTGTEARPSTTTQGVGHHTELRHASTGEPTEVKAVGVLCKPKIRDVCSGPDLPMSFWEVRERVETRDKAVGIHVFTTSQAVGTEVKVCDSGSNTEVKQRCKKGNLVSCAALLGECSLNEVFGEAKEAVSHEMATDQIRGVDLGVTASPQMASQRTNTVSNSVCRSTNTKYAFCTDSSTNTVLSTQDKHTNTAYASTRTVSVGHSVREFKCSRETQTFGTANLDERNTNPRKKVMKLTRDTGVGFTNIYDNFLVGLKSRNMASGPSHLPDPVKTKSIGVGEGKIQDLTPVQSLQPASQQQWDQELNHYIEKMQWLLRDHGDLLSDDCTDHSSTQRVASNKETQGQTHRVTSAAVRDCQPALDSPPCDDENSSLFKLGGNEVKRRIKILEEQNFSAVPDESRVADRSQHVAQKQVGDKSCSNNRKNLKFLKVTTGLNPMCLYGHPEVENGGNRALKKEKHSSKKAPKGSAKSHTHQKCELGERMFSACQALKKHLSGDALLSSRDLHECLHTLQQEWFSTSSVKSAVPANVEQYLSTFRSISPSVLQHIANLADGNGNTALHYSVSHSNFDVVKKLLDAAVCNVNQQNTAGYTPVMLAALAAVDNAESMKVVEQLFAKGNVNIKASQAGQTALMLAVSHGRIDMVRALLAQGAEVNVQDDEGSTALMCASEHGHTDIVKLLLARPQCDATLTDSDDSTALSIALEAGHHDIALLLYAHANFSKAHTAFAHHSGKFLSPSGGKDV
uniref:KN motif and ankyrin repeat domain-containing protein 1-like n=2 Tax=Gouania willdenowi TaxID=441366 RepID=A0A8C5GYA0_GOUWI